MLETRIGDDELYFRAGVYYIFDDNYMFTSAQLEVAKRRYKKYVQKMEKKV